MYITPKVLGFRHSNSDLGDEKSVCSKMMCPSKSKSGENHCWSSCFRIKDVIVRSILASTQIPTSRRAPSTLASKAIKVSCCAGILSRRSLDMSQQSAAKKWVSPFFRQQKISDFGNPSNHCILERQMAVPFYNLMKGSRAKAKETLEPRSVYLCLPLNHSIFQVPGGGGGTHNNPVNVLWEGAMMEIVSSSMLPWPSVRKLVNMHLSK